MKRSPVRVRLEAQSKNQDFQNFTKAYQSISLFSFANITNCFAPFPLINFSIVLQNGRWQHSKSVYLNTNSERMGDSLSRSGLPTIENLYTWKQVCMRPDHKSQKILVRWKIGLSHVRSTVNYKNTKNWLFRSSDGKSTIGELTKILKSIEPDSDAYGDLSESPILQNSVSDTTIHLNAENYNDVIRPQKDTILLSKGISE